MLETSPSGATVFSRCVLGYQSRSDDGLSVTKRASVRLVTTPLFDLKSGKATR